jgi:hypothetical protein
MQCTAGQLHFEAKEYSEAGEAWEQLVAARDGRDDAYARLGLANLQLISVQTDSNKVPAPFRSLSVARLLL